MERGIAQAATPDINKLRSARKALKRDWLIFTICFIGFLPMALMGELVNGRLAITTFGLVAVVLGLLFFIEGISIIFRIRFVYQAMGKSLAVITLFQLGTILTGPFGFFIFPRIVLHQSKKLLSQGGANS